MMGMKRPELCPQREGRAPRGPPRARGTRRSAGWSSFSRLPDRDNKHAPAHETATSTGARAGRRRRSKAGAGGVRVSSAGAASQRSAETLLPKSGSAWRSPGHRSFHRLIDVIALISPVANTTLFLAHPGQALSRYSTPGH